MTINISSTSTITNILRHHKDTIRKADMPEMSEWRRDTPSSTIYRRIVSRKLLAILLAITALLLTLFVDIMTGPALLPMHTVVQAIFQPAHIANPAIVTIVNVLRLPTAVMAVVVGASLGMAGAQMQTILSNPLASPYTLGVAAAASFGAALAMLAGKFITSIPGPYLIPLFAFIFALLATLGISAVARLKGGASETIILAGIALAYLFSALLSFLQYLAGEQLSAIVFWMFGSMSGANWSTVGLVSLVLLITFALMSSDAWKLTALKLGDNKATSLGVNVAGLRLKTMALVSLVTATAICFVGTIGFIGLVAPHLARRCAGEDQRFFLPFSILIGALLLSAASVLSKTLVPHISIPIGIMTSLIGIPFLLVIVLRRKSVQT